MAIPNRIVLVGSTSQKLSNRFANLRPAPDRYAMDGPRNFLYDDYMESDLYGEGPADTYGTSDRGPSSSYRRSGTRATADLDLDTYSTIRRQSGRRQPPVDDFGSYRTSQKANRFAMAVGINPRRQPDIRRQTGFNNIVVERRPRPQTQRRVVRQYVQDYDDPVEEVVQVVRPSRPIRVVKKVPIQQRVKKVIVKTVGNTRRGAFKPGTSRNQGKPIPRRNKGGIQKKKATHADLDRELEGITNSKNKFTKKPKASHSDLDQELDEYMRSSKHPRINV